MRRVLISVVCAVAAGGALMAASAQADFPYPTPAGGSHDWTTLHIPSGTLPNDLDPNGQWRFYSTPEANNFPTNAKPNELNGIRGGWVADADSTVKTAWSVTTGRPDVTIAELDSGVKWNDPGFVRDERFKIALNAGELPTPNHSGPDLVGGVNCASYANQDDANGDGVFNLLDFACDSRLSKAPPNGAGPSDLLDPEDLIIAFSNGTDEDGNGYVDDIAGWDFLDNDPDPYDDVQYGHGSGEILGSTAEANNKGGTPGFCPNCMAIPLRVGNSFVADDNRFAMATTYAVDRGVDIVQEALGTLNDSHFGQAAIDYAYRHGVVVIASAADEAAQHHNYPSAHAHPIVVNSVTKYDSTDAPKSYLAFNGCTNFSSKITLAIPSTSCSSNATEVGAGMAGLVYSAARNAVEQHKLSPSPSCKRVDGSACPITANEVRQLMASGSFGPTAAALQTQPDDINYLAPSASEPSCSPSPSPGCTDPNLALQTQVNAARPIVSPPGSRSYPARFGPDQFFGYGRVNAWRAADQVANGHVPPEVEITSPQWFAQVSPDSPAAEVRAQVSARGAEYTCAVFVAPGSYPNNHRTTDASPGDFKQVPSPVCDGTTKRTAAIDGAVAALDLADLKSRFPNDATANGFHGVESGSGAGQTSNGRPNSEPYGFTVRVVATTTAENPGLTATGEDQRNLYLHRDQDMLAGFPRKLAGDGASSPALADLNGDNRNELLFGTSDGDVHAMRPDGTELPGWPVRTDRLPVHAGEHAFTSGELSPETSRGALLASVAVADLDRDGTPEVIASDMEGKVYVWNARGGLVWKREANPAWSGKPLTPFVNERDGRRDRTMHAFIASPVAADLDHNGTLEVIAASMDRHLYAWGADGSQVGGFPLLVTDPDKTASITPGSQEVRFDPTKAPKHFDNPDQPWTEDTPDQGAIIDTPALADLNGDGRPEILLGTNEEYTANAGNEGPTNIGGANAQTIQNLGPLLAAAGLNPGNSRLYAIKPTGDLDGNPKTADWLFGGRWPVKIALLATDLLPVVGEGMTGAPAVAPLTCPSGGAGNKIGVIPNNGVAYVLNADGSSCLGESGGKYQVMDTDKGGGGDHPAFAAVGHTAFGNFAGGMSLLAPVAGLNRALDLGLNEYQTGGQDFISAWDPTNGQFRTGYPARMNDLQFITGPSLADIDGKAGDELLEASAYLDLQAFDGQGQPIPGWPKLTSDWVVANPLIGTWGTRDTDAGVKRTVVSLTRNGTMLAYRTPAPPCQSGAQPLGQWPKFHHDLANSGDYSRDAVDPGTPMGAAFKDGKLTFLAPGDDLLCGRVARYEAVQADFPVVGANFAQGDPVPTGAIKIDDPGKPQTLQLGGRLRRYLAIRAVDEQGNVGPVTRVVAGPAPPPPGDPCGDVIAPQTAINANTLKRTKTGMTVKGVSKDAGCKTLAVAMKRNRLLVSISIARKENGKCRFLKHDRNLSRPRSCNLLENLRAGGAYSFKARTLTWSFQTRARLPKGDYTAIAHAVDQSGNVERKLTKQNRRTFKLQKPPPRPSAAR